ncbi:MAG TPA: twin-arginine translocase TatA/TatE family subunit [Candidatus Dormibacteraeota bacterium]|jgi:sec-independent protein translocase protein TatA
MIGRVFGHSWIVIVILLVIVLVIFGPGKLGQVGGALGKSIREFRKTSSEGDEPAAARDNGAAKTDSGADTRR